MKSIQDFWFINDLTRAFLDNIDRGIIGLDDKNCIRAWNGWMVQQSGLSAETVHGKQLTDLFPDLPKTTVEIISQVLNSGQPRILSPALHSPLFPRLTSRHLLVRLVSLNTPENPIHGVIIVIQDMSGLLTYEGSITSRYKSLVDSSSDHIFMLDLEGRYVASNDRVDQFELERGTDLVGKHYREVYPDEAAGLYAKQLDHLRKTGDSVRFEYQMPWSDEFRYDEVVLYPLKKGAEIYSVGGICRDITEKRRTEQALEERIKERTADLEKKTRELEKFNRLFVDRELRMVELKNEIKKLRERL